MLRSEDGREFPFLPNDENKTDDWDDNGGEGNVAWAPCAIDHNPANDSAQSVCDIKGGYIGRRCKFWGVAAMFHDAHLHRWDVGKRYNTKDEGGGKEEVGLRGNQADNDQRDDH